MKCAIVGGSNMETLPLPYREEVVATPYGDVVLFCAQLDDGHEVLFRSRHGVLYSQDPPHVNYRANMYALHLLGVTHIVGVTTVGACDYALRLGSICLVSDFIDFTRARPATFERSHRLFEHTGMEDVFDPGLNDALERLILSRGIAYSGRAVYACTEGPRFETAAEARMLRMLGAQIVGMTLVPEAPLARDLGMKYASIATIGNYCTGMSAAVTDEGIGEIVSAMRSEIFELCFDLIRQS